MKTQEAESSHYTEALRERCIKCYYNLRHGLIIFQLMMSIQWILSQKVIECLLEESSMVDLDIGDQTKDSKENPVFDLPHLVTVQKICMSRFD